MKLRILLLISLLFVSATAQADFINGGFETGDTTGWTLNGGSYYGSYGGYNYTGDPGLTSVVGQGFDPITGLPTVYNGNNAIRVNNFQYNYPFSSISQTLTWTDPIINFVWAAVLEEPTNLHPIIDEPQFSILLHDDTTNMDLYNISFSTVQQATLFPNLMQTSNVDPNWNGGQWYYTPWMNITLDTSQNIGHSLTLTVIAAACGWGGHGGYAYVDAISNSTLPPNPGVNPATGITTDGTQVDPVPEPATFILLGIGLLNFFGIRKKSKK